MTLQIMCHTCYFQSSRIDKIVTFFVLIWLIISNCLSSLLLIIRAFMQMLNSSFNSIYGGFYNTSQLFYMEFDT